MTPPEGGPLLTNLPEKRAPTHVLRIDVPLNLTDEPQEYNAVEVAVRVCLALTRAAYDGRICDQVMVTVTDVDAVDGEG